MKKKIPLAILESLQPLVHKNLNLVETVKNDDVIFHLKDKDLHSDLYYKIIRKESSNNQSGYIIEYKPSSKDDISLRKIWIKNDLVSNSIQNWLAIIEEYNNMLTIYDDPIIKSNQERFEKKFETLDEDANYSSFDLQQQTFLYEYLNNTKSIILKHNEGKSEDEIAELKDLINDADEIQKNLTKETKKIIVKRLSKFWAKAQKFGLNVIQEILVAVSSDFIQKILSK
ncbi:MAG: hypothetical protein V4667_10750 [Bacteroidota bacterium]